MMANGSSSSGITGLDSQLAAVLLERTGVPRAASRE